MPIAIQILRTSVASPTIAAAVAVEDAESIDVSEFAAGCVRSSESGTFDVYVSLDNGVTDDFEPFHKDSDGNLAQLVLTANTKKELPSWWYSIVGFVKLVGVAADIRFGLIG